MTTRERNRPMDSMPENNGSSSEILDGTALEKVAAHSNQDVTCTHWPAMETDHVIGLYS